MWSITFEDFILGSIHSLLSKECRKIILSISSKYIARVISNKTIGNRKPQWLISSLFSTSINNMEYGYNQSMPPEWKGHKICERIIVYHEANKAGPHIDTYLVIDGKAYSIGVKRLQEHHMRGISKRNGLLTEKSKAHIISIIKDEYVAGAWLAQTTDHTPGEARTAWSNNAYNGVYGAGEMRQVVLDSPVSVFSTGDSIEFRDWNLNPNSNAYVFRIMNTKPNIRNKPVLKLGFKKLDNPKFQDRLHLKPHIGTNEFDRFRRLVGEDGVITIKHDGASFYFETNSKGTKFYSPRISKETKHRIDYNAKFKDLVHITSNTKISGMGELNYINTSNNKILTAAETGGILNSHSPLPNNIEPQLTIYRIDNIGRKLIYNIPYCENLASVGIFVHSVADNRIQEPKIVAWDIAKDIAIHEEGLVGIPNNLPISEGRKYKPRGDLFDWTITKVELKPGPSSGIAGVVRFKNESGKHFKIGASSMGNHRFAREIMRNPRLYEGRVARVSCYRGHEGRASKLVDFHLDKGSL